MVCGSHIAVLSGENGKPVCRSDWLCDFVHKYPCLHSAILRPGFRAGSSLFTRPEESVLHPILPVYLCLQYDCKCHFSLWMAKQYYCFDDCNRYFLCPAKRNFIRTVGIRFVTGKPRATYGTTPENILFRQLCC